MPMQAGVPVLGTFSVSSIASGTTVAAVLVPPFPGPGGGNPPYLYNAQAPYADRISSAPVPTKANWLQAPLFGVPHLTSIQVTASSTQHTLLVLRPLNWTYFPNGLPKNTTVIPDTGGAAGTGIFDDPGIYTTNYRYPTPGGVFPARAADAGISSTNKSVCYQLADGSWFYDTIASGTFGSTLTLTTGTPNRTAGNILPGAPMFYFGAVAGTLVDPATGNVGLGTVTLVSVVSNYNDTLVGGISALHPGDPLLIYDANASAADSIIASGYYGAF